MNLLNFSASPILRILTGKKRQPQEPAIASATIATFRELIATPAWKAYKEFLDARITLEVQALLASSSDAECHRLRGYIQGLLHSAQIPESLVMQDDNARTREQRIALSAEQRGATARASTFATGYWGN